MKIGILSDTHNQASNTCRALDLLRERGAEQLIHCGDITTPEIVGLFEGWPVVFVFGNMDHHAAALARAVEKLDGAVIGYQFTAEIEGRRIAVCHGHDAQLLKEMTRAGLYDYVFHGHTHRRRHERVGETSIINPGALGGLRRQSRSVCVVDLAAGRVDFIDLENL